MKMPDSLFVEFCRNRALIKAIDFLMECRGYDYSKRQICQYTGVSAKQLSTIWGKLERHGLVAYTKTHGKTCKYTFNKHNLLSQKLLELDKALMRQAMDEWDEKAVVPNRQKARQKP